MVAEQGRSHLDTPVAGDPVEVVLVTLVSAAYASFQPEAGLDRAVSHKMVALFLQLALYLRGKIIHV